MMTLDEAIEHAEWAANNCEGECSDEHRQLAEWLRQLADEQRKVLILMTEASSLRAKNEKLRELVETMYGDMREILETIDKGSDTWGYCRYYGECLDAAEGIMRELGIEVGA